MNIPANLKYTKTDEWFDPATHKAGLSDYAQNQLSDIVFVEVVVSVGGMLQAGKQMASVESVKAAAESYARSARRWWPLTKACRTTPSY